MKKLKSRVLSFILTVCLLAGMQPMSAQAIELEDGEFNPNTGEVEINFNVQFTQEVSIEVLVNNEHFGWLIRNKELFGYDGAMVPHDPCASYTVPPASDLTYSAGVAAAAEVRIDAQNDESGNPLGSGYYTIYWTGSINGKPAVSANPDSDKYSLKISIQPQGYPGRGKTPCTDPDNDVHDGEDWIWTQQFVAETEIELDYGTILNKGGLADLFIAKKTICPMRLSCSR